MKSQTSMQSPPNFLGARSEKVAHRTRAKEWTWMAASAFVVVAFFVSGLLVQT